MLGRQDSPERWESRTGDLVLRQGSSRERQQVNWLWNHAACRFRVPGREQLDEMLARTPNLLAYRGNRLCAAVLLSLLRRPVVEVRRIALLQQGDLAMLGDVLLPALVQRCADANLTWLSLHDCPAWLEGALPRAGFHREADVVSLHLYDWPDTPPVEVDLGRVRRASLVDTDAVLDIDTASFAPFWRINRALVREALGHGAYSLLAEIEGVPVGYLLAERWPSEAYVSRIGVIPKRQGSGIGHMLMGEALRCFRVDGVERVVLNTQRDNTRSMRLYASLGFAPTGDVSVYWSRNLAVTRVKGNRYIAETPE